MWRLIKAEVSYKFWEPLAYYLGGWILTFGLWKLQVLSPSELHKSDPFYYFPTYVLSALFLPLGLASSVFQGREFKEKRLRKLIPLPVSIGQVASARILTLFAANLIGLSLSLVGLHYITILGTTDIAIRMFVISLLCFIFVLEGRLTVELQYLSRKGKLASIILWMVTFFILIPLFVSRLRFAFAKTLWRWLQEPLGLASLVALLLTLLYINRAVFLGRRDYSKVFKPQVAILDLIRSYREERPEPKKV